MASESEGVAATRLQYSACSFARAVAQAEIERAGFAALLKNYLREVGATSRVNEVVRRVVYGS